MEARTTPRVVLVHDWLTGMRGGEKCLEVAARHWPEAQLYALLHQPGSVSEAIEALQPRPSFLNSLPGVRRYYRYLLPLMPTAVASWRFPPCDLVVSFSHCVAKGAMAPQGTPHVCYCFTPMRYAWHMREAYFAGRFRGIKRPLLAGLLAWLRSWDRRTAQHVTHFLAISETVKQRIAECYQRDSTVIYPPVDTDFYSPASAERGSHYLIVSAFAPYKRLDLAIHACNQLQRDLVIIGTGQDEARLRSLAGPTIHFLGWQPDSIIRHQLQRCRALLFPGEEDFGIVPVEAMACGAPVIAFGRGGATETIIPLPSPTPALSLTAPTRVNSPSSAEPTGLWFAEQTVECLVDALQTFEKQADDFSPLASRRQALRFTHQRFAEELFAYLYKVLDAGETTREKRQAA